MAGMAQQRPSLLVGEGLGLGVRGKRSKRRDELEEELVALEAVFNAGFMVPSADETHAIVVILHRRTKREHFSSATIRANLLAIQFIVTGLLKVVAANARCPGAEVLTDQIIHVEIVAGLIVGVVVLGLDVVHQLGRNRSGSGR